MPISSTKHPLPIAYKKTDFLYATRNINEDISCASGPKQELDLSRRKETDELLEEQRLDTTNTIKTATQNDKLIARCENGVWIKPSHECLCEEEISRREEILKYSPSCHRINRDVAGQNRIDDGASKTRPEESSKSERIVMTSCGLLPVIFYEFMN